MRYPPRNLCCVRRKAYLHILGIKDDKLRLEHDVAEDVDMLPSIGLNASVAV